MATVTKPIALDESLNTTELSSRNVADVLAQELSAVATAIGGISAPSAEDVSYDNSGSGLSATDVQNAIDELSSEKADSSSLATVATSGDYDDLINKPTIPTVNDATLTIQKNGSDVATFTANASSNVTANIAVPTTTSELTNNSDFVSDASYVHTDNNFTNAEKTKLSSIESGAEVNVQSDWNQTDNTEDDYIKNKPSSEVKSATDTFTTVNGGLLSKCQINLVPVQSGSGDPSPDNVRPISGHTEVDLYNVGKNRLPLVLADIKSANTSGTWSRNVYSYGGGTLEILVDDGDNVIGFKVNGTFTSTLYFYPHGTTLPSQFLNQSYILSGGDGGVRVRAYHYDGTNNAVSQNGEETSAFTFTTLSSAIDIVIPSGTTVNNVTIQPMLRLSTESDPTFEPYLGHLYQVQIGSTVYGGTVDLVSGVMAANKASVDLGTLTWGVQSTSVTGKNRFRTGDISSVDKKPSANNVVAEIISSNYKAITAENTYFLNDEGVSLDTAGAILIYDSTKETLTAEQFKTAVNGFKLVYTLATPLTIQLTPQQIETLAGQNNLSCPLDGQTIDSVEYREVFAFDDVEKIVNLRVPISMLGTDESGRTTASQSYASGDYFYKDGYMCKALTSISAGATLTLNTNYSQGTLADILKAIENA